MNLTKTKLLQIVPLLIGLISWLLIDLHVVSSAPLFMLQIILFLSVIFVIWEGANVLVDSSVQIARHFKVPPFLIGLTIVAFGTSVPELITSGIAGFAGKGDIAIANVVGSNIFNISIILGGLTFLSKDGLLIGKYSRRLDAPLLLLGSLMILLFIGQVPFESNSFSFFNQIGLLDFKLGFIEGLILAAIFFIYLYVIIKNRNNSDLVPEIPKTNIEQSHNKNSLLKDFLYLFVGLGIVILGCHVLLGKAEPIDNLLTGYGAIWFATIFDLPDFFIGLSIVALGTSLPEIVVSISAYRAKSVEIGVGNLLGSAVFNVFAVTGITGLLVQPPLAQPITVHGGTQHSLVAMGFMFIVLLFFFFTDQRLSRKEGFVLFVSGISYMMYELIINVL